MNFKRSWLTLHDLSHEGGFADMAFDLFNSLFTLGAQLTLVVGAMLFIVSIAQDFRNMFSRHE